MIKKDLIDATNSKNFSEACFKIGFTRQQVYSLFSKGEEDTLLPFIGKEALKKSVRRYEKIKEKIDQINAKDDDRIRNVYLVNISAQSNKVTLNLTTHAGINYLQTVDIELFLSEESNN